MVGTFVEEQKVLNVQTSQKIEAVESSLSRKLDNMHSEILKLSNQQLQRSEKEKAPFQGQQYQNMVTVQANHETETVESSLNKELDGFQSEIAQKLDILQESISKLAQQPDHKEEENPEDEWTGTILGEQVQLQPQEELKMESLEAPEELQDAPVNFWPWTKEEQISALITEESSGHETGEEPQEPILQPIPMKLNPSATAQPQNNPLPVAPSDDLVYIQPPPAANSKPAAPKARSNPSLHAMKNLKILVAYVHKFATTSKAQAAAYMAWHSGWFWCGFGFGASEPRHF